MSHLAIWEMEGEKMAGSGECMLSLCFGYFPAAGVKLLAVVG